MTIAPKTMSIRSTSNNPVRDNQVGSNASPFHIKTSDHGINNSGTKKKKKRKYKKSQTAGTTEQNSLNSSSNFLFTATDNGNEDIPCHDIGQSPKSKRQKSNKKPAPSNGSLEQNNLNSSNNTTTADTGTMESTGNLNPNGSEGAQSQTKKKRSKKKKKKVVLEGDKVPVPKAPPVKKPEYSSNWKQLQEVLAKEKSAEHKPVTINKGNPKHLPVKSGPGKPQHQFKAKHKNAFGSTHQARGKEQDSEKEEDIWFDNVDPALLDAASKADRFGSGERRSTATLVEEDSYTGVTDIIGLDCEMVGVGINGKDSMLARVSIVNQYGHPLYDKFVQPMEQVQDYRTHVSGVRPSDLETAEPFLTVQQEVGELMKDKTLVGHAIQNDLKALFLTHPRSHIRDTARYGPFRKLFDNRTPGLKKLTDRILKVQIQEGEHSSLQDAQATMRLYMLHRKEWEAMLLKGNKRWKNGRMKQHAFNKKARKKKSGENEKPAVSSDNIASTPVM